MTGTWLELWQSVRRYVRNGEVLAELSQSNGIWHAYRTGPDGPIKFGNNADLAGLKRHVELALQ